MTTLFELTAQYERLIYGIEKPEWTATPDDYQAYLKENLALIKDQIEDKVENIGKVILTLKADIDCIESEGNRLADRQEAMEQKVDWLKAYLLREMTAAGIDKLQRPIVTVSLRRSPPSCEVVDATQIPVIFLHIIPEQLELDKRAIINHFKESGEIVAGVRIITDKKFVVIK